MEEYRPLEKYYRTYTYMLKKKFGQNVIRVSLDGGFSCPNRDGTKGIGGCIFCDNSSFSPVSSIPNPIKTQIHYVMEHLKHPEKYAGFIAYFQPFTNTYAPVDKLRKIYYEAIEEEGCLGLALGTRPDCVPEDVLTLLEEINEKYFVTVELGLQSVYNDSLKFINRGHTFEDFVDAANRAKKHGLTVAAHIILGIPGETKEMMLRSCEVISNLPIDILKIHQLQIVKDTKLEQIYNETHFKVWDIEEYSDFITDFVEYLRDGLYIQRLFSRSVSGNIVAPRWNVKLLTDTIMQKFQEKDTRQGKKFKFKGE
jgi:hypothetical protein